MTDRLQVLILLSDGRISVTQAERMLFPDIRRNTRIRRDSVVHGESVIHAMQGVLLGACVSLIFALWVHPVSAQQVWETLQTGWHAAIGNVHGPTVVRHLHALFSNLLGGFV
jgi:hypothetical protein